MSGPVRLVCFIGLLLTALALGVFTRPLRFETSIQSLIGEDSIVPSSSVRQAVSSKVQVVSSAPSFDEALDLADRFASGIDTNRLVDFTFRIGGEKFARVMDFYARSGGGFVSAGDRSAAESGSLLAEIVKDYSFAAPSLFPFRVDPYRFLDRFVKTLPREFGSWQMKNEVLASQSDGKWHILISFALPANAALDIKRLPAVLSPIVERCRRINADSASGELTVTGVPVHTLEASSRCESEIAFLSFFSFVFVLILAFKVLKRRRALVMVGINLLVSSVAGFVAVVFAFDAIHLIALVFATTLIGLAVDYSFHCLLAPEGEESAVKAKLTKSLLTTLASLVPLAFSGLPALMQTALFLAAGLISSYIFNCEILKSKTLKVRPKGGGKGFTTAMETSMMVDLLFAAIIILSIGGVFFARFYTDGKDLHTPSAELLRAEKLISELSGIDPSTALVTVEGKSLEETLVKEERHFSKNVCLSRFVPSELKRKRDFAFVKSFCEKRGEEISAALGLSASLPLPPSPAKIELGDIPEEILRRFLIAGDDGKVMTLVSSVDLDEARKAAEEEGVSFYAPRLMLTKLINRYEDRALMLLMLSFAILLAVLWAFYRLRSLLMIVPAVLSVMAVFAAVTFTGENVNFFHLLASFMLMGMSLDYTIFLADRFRESSLSVISALLTSLVGFGALAFVSFPIVRAFGVAFSVGLPVSFFAAWAIFRPRAKADERIATPVGMEAAYMLYRLFGKRMFDFIARAVADIVWVFDPGSRAAALSRKKIENFAQSIVDKIAVLSMGSGQPKVRFEESEDTEEFLSDIAGKKGAVVLSSHLGCIETLAAYGESAVKFHVFMSLSATSVFRAFRERHSHRSMIEVHPTEGFGMAELFLGSAIVDEGAVVLIAGDRGGGRMKTVSFAGSEHSFPEGAFRFARHLERNVYFVASVLESGGYRAFVKRLSPENMFTDYVKALEVLVLKYPEQWYQWERSTERNG